MVGNDLSGKVEWVNGIELAIVRLQLRIGFGIRSS